MERTELTLSFIIVGLGVAVIVLLLTTGFTFIK